MNKIRDCSIKESSSISTTPSSQTLMEEFKAVVLEKVELENRDMSLPMQFRPIKLPIPTKGPNFMTF